MDNVVTDECVGCAGFLAGGTVGVLRGTTPFLFATASSIQTFALGTTFWATRTSILQTGLAAQQTPNDLIKVSSLAGALSGGIIAAVTRGRRNVLPATLMWSLFGAAGQYAYNRYDGSRNSAAPVEEGTFWTRMSKKGWSPIKFISNEDYAEMLREKMLKLDTEIAVLDDKIAALKEQVGDKLADSTAPSEPKS